MLMAEQEPYALMVQPDDMLISPREVNDNFGTMVCFYPRYALGDHHNYVDKDGNVPKHRWQQRARHGTL